MVFLFATLVTLLAATMGAFLFARLVSIQVATLGAFLTASLVAFLVAKLLAFLVATLLAFLVATMVAFLVATLVVDYFFVDWALEKILDFVQQLGVDFDHEIVVDLPTLRAGQENFDFEVFVDQEIDLGEHVFVALVEQQTLEEALIVHLTDLNQALVALQGFVVDFVQKLELED